MVPVAAADRQICGRHGRRAIYLSMERPPRGRPPRFGFSSFKRARHTWLCRSVHNLLYVLLYVVGNLGIGGPSCPNGLLPTFTSGA